jgi:hypothetical protein
MANNYNSEHETALNKIMGNMPDAEAGKMFGYPGYKVNGKLAAGLHKEGIIVKIGRDRAAEVISKGTGAKFEPLPGRVWKDWVLLTSDFDKNAALFKEAVENVKKETA